MIGILAFIAIFIATYFVYKTARENNRNAFLWAGATFAVGFGIQVVIPLLLGVVLAVIWMAMGNPLEDFESGIQGPATIIGIICLPLSFVGIGLIFRQVAKIPDDDDHLAAGPPPPPNFSG